MTKEEYLRIVSILKNNYPKMQWSAERHNWLWNKIRDELATDLADAVDDLIGWRNTPPNPKNVIEEIKKIKLKRPGDSQNKKESLVKSLPWCEYCGKEGYVVANKIMRDPITGDTNVCLMAPFQFKCSCEAGKILNYPFQEWTKEMRRDYEYNPCLEDKGDVMNFMEFQNQNPEFKNEFIENYLKKRGAFDATWKRID